MRVGLTTLMGLVLLVGLGLERAYTHFGTGDRHDRSSRLRSGRLSRLDNAKLERGYYENLLQVDRFNSQLWEVYMKRPANWLDIESGGAEAFHHRLRTGRAQAFVHVRHELSARSRINRWGMRDQDYELKPSPGTLRMVLLGPSTVMGWGVGDGATFEALVEKRLNDEAASKPHSKYEILNLAVPGYQPPQQLVCWKRHLASSRTPCSTSATGREMCARQHAI